MTLSRTTEATVKLRLAAVGHMRNAAGQTQAEGGTARTAVVVAAGEVGVLADSEQLRLAPGDLLGRRIRRAGEHEAPANTLGASPRPPEPPHPAHRASQDCRPGGDPQPVR